MNRPTHALITITLAAVLAACGGGSDDSKPLFSLWKRQTDGVPIDLSGGQFNTPLAMTSYTASGVQCLCELVVIGDDASGAYVLRSCIASPYNATDDKMCKAGNGTGRYTNGDGLLTMTRSDGASATFR